MVYHHNYKIQLQEYTIGQKKDRKASTYLQLCPNKSQDDKINIQSTII